jgi:TRIAD3 protein (E3 ubiquitin-protein ligase RNF216)
MSTSGCKSIFSRPEIERFVDPPMLKRLDNLHFISGTRNIPGLEGMEECPFCDFKALMDPITADEETLWFTCMSKGCGKYSCRKCKEVWHPGKKCGEGVEDQKLDVRHLIAEAMTAALIQSCK